MRTPGTRISRTSLVVYVALVCEDEERYPGQFGCCAEGLKLGGGQVVGRFVHDVHHKDDGRGPSDQLLAKLVVWGGAANVEGGEDEVALCHPQGAARHGQEGAGQVGHAGDVHQQSGFTRALKPDDEDFLLFDEPVGLHRVDEPAADTHVVVVLSNCSGCWASCSVVSAFGHLVVLSLRLELGCERTERATVSPKGKRHLKRQILHFVADVIVSGGAKIDCRRHASCAVECS